MSAANASGRSGSWAAANLVRPLALTGLALQSAVLGAWLLVPWAIALAGVQMALSYLGGYLPSVSYEVTMTIDYLALLAVLVCFASANCARILTPERRFKRGLLGLAFGKAEAVVVILCVMLFAGAVVVQMPVTLVVSEGAAPEPSAFDGVGAANVIGLLAMGIAAWLALRLSLVLPLFHETRKVSVAQAWALSRGKLVFLGVLALVTLISAVVVTYVLNLPIDALIWQLLTRSPNQLVVQGLPTLATIKAFLPGFVTTALLSTSLALACRELNTSGTAVQGNQPTG